MIFFIMENFSETSIDEDFLYFILDKARTQTMSTFPITYKLTDLQNSKIQVDDFREIKCKNGQTSIVLKGTKNGTPIQCFANNKVKQYINSGAFTLPFNCLIDTQRSFTTVENGCDKTITYIPVSISSVC